MVYLISESTLGSLTIVSSGVIGLLFGMYQHFMITQVNLTTQPQTRSIRPTEGTPLVGTTGILRNVVHYHSLIEEGVKDYFRAQYGLCFSFSLCFAFIIFCIIAWTYKNSPLAIAMGTSYLAGSLLAACVGIIGAHESVQTGVRTTVTAQQDGNLGYMKSFTTAFRGGAAFSFMVCSIVLLVLYGCFEVLRIFGSKYHEVYPTSTIVLTVLSLGVSVLAMFVRIGGGTFSTAMDIGNNLIGKVMYDIQEDNPHNPAVIGDLVGDNIGHVAGMGTDLIGSWVECTCAALYIFSVTPAIVHAGFLTICFPFFILSSGILVCMVTSFIATSSDPESQPRNVELTLRVHLLVTAILIIPLILTAIFVVMPDGFTFVGISNTRHISAYDMTFCMMLGLFGALVYGLITEYFTSNKYDPVQRLALSAAKGAASEIMHGVSVGYSSVLPSAIVLSVIVFFSYEVADVIGIVLASLGVISLMPAYLIVALFGPICDNAAGIAGLANLEKATVDKTIALDNTGSSLNAIAKGYSTSCAFFSALTMFAALAIRVKMTFVATTPWSSYGPIIIVFLLIGASLSYWVTSTVLNSVNKSIEDVVTCVSQQLNEHPLFADPGSGYIPDYQSCIDTAILSSIQGLAIPASIGILFPILIGVLFGVIAMLAMISGFIVSAVHKSAAMSNTGGAWNSAKRIIRVSESDKGLTELYKATVIGDTLGDPMKDACGPALDILMKLMVTSTFVFLPFYIAINDGRGLLDMYAH